MKFRVTLKDPDGFYEGVEDAVKDSLKAIEGLSDDERESLVEDRVASVNSVIGRWVEFGEYVDIEFDTEAETARVVPKGEADGG